VKFYVFIACTFVLFSSCQHSAIKQNFSSADSLVIHFKDEQAGVVTKTVQTTESKAISRMIEFIDSKRNGSTQMWL
jgi:hypothetical protein